MTIKQALKEKNKLKGLITEELKKFQTFNSVYEGVIAPYSAKVALKNYIDLTEELITLKTKIHLANAPVYSDIFRLSELKTIISNIYKVDCTSGKEVKTHYGRESETLLKTAEVSVVERDEQVKKFQDEIDSIQDKLDIFNSVTKISE